MYRYCIVVGLAIVAMPESQPQTNPNYEIALPIFNNLRLCEAPDQTV